MSTYEKLNSFLINIIYLVFSSLEMQRRLILTKLYYKFFKETSHKPSKVAATENFFPDAYVISTACFDRWLLFHFIIRKHDFYPEVFCN